MRWPHYWRHALRRWPRRRGRGRGAVRCSAVDLAGPGVPTHPALARNGFSCGAQFQAFHRPPGRRPRRGPKKYCRQAPMGKGAPLHTRPENGRLGGA